MAQQNTTEPLLRGIGFQFIFDITPGVKGLHLLKKHCNYEQTKDKPTMVTKSMPDGGMFSVERYSEDRVTVIYKGKIQDVGHMKFLVENIYDDLAECELVAKRDQEFIPKATVEYSEPTQTSMIN